jgi:hypothetical protein
MLSYDNRALALGSSHANSAQVSPGSPTMGNNMASMEHMVGDHMLSSGLHKVPSQPRQRTEHQHIWLITGPAGCGKSTVAQHVAESLKLPYIEGDEVSLQQLTPTPALVANYHTTVPPPSEYREDVKRHPAYRPRPLGLAHHPAPRCDEGT